ncbi:hypothetical protein [Treponema primitia]|uniref:hypothetical protein n=1 Tax=Treponema primitia TaxID=88058 RepID=UPI0002F68B56|nr:hypothetical protein [Treponema primitia]
MIRSRVSQDNLSLRSSPFSGILNQTGKIISPVGDIEGEFYIPSYQRGYRWKEEVAMLLNDIDEIAEGQNYWL